MDTIKKEEPNRLIFFDNLRYLFVLCVVLQHSGSAYSGIFVKWWSVWESNSSLIVILLQGFFDAFTMPLLFFIAGYFAIPTIKKYGILSFIRGKLKRLGIPWVVCILTIVPVYTLIYHYTRDNMSLSKSFLDIWINQIKNAVQFNVGFFTRDKIVIYDGFFLRYMWFISLLLLFFVIFSLIYRIKKNWFDKNYADNAGISSISSTFKLWASVGLLSLIGSIILFIIMAVTGKIFDPTAWFTLGNIIQFQFIRIAPYILYFSIGAIMYRNKWIERGKFPGHLKTWMTSFIILLIFYLYSMYEISNRPANSKAMLVYGLIYFVVQNFLTISILGFFSSLAIKYWNKSRKIDQSFSSASYDIYLSHYIFVVVFQLVLFLIPGIPVLLKFGIVSTLSILCTYLLSHFLIKPFPKLTVILIFVILCAMFVGIKP